MQCSVHKVHSKTKKCMQCACTLHTKKTSKLLQVQNKSSYTHNLNLNKIINKITFINAMNKFNIEQYCSTEHCALRTVRAVVQCIHKVPKSAKKGTLGCSACVQCAHSGAVHTQNT
jgi:hypothetical protein